MTKIRAQGADVLVRAAIESVYGTPPAGGWRSFLVTSWNAGYAMPLARENELGQGPEAADPYYGPTDVKPQFEALGHVDAIGYLLRMALGAPVTTGTGPYTHVYTTGKTLDSFSIEEGHSEIGLYRVARGFKAGKLDVSLGRTGALKLKIDGHAQDFDSANASVAGAPTAYSQPSFMLRNCDVKLDGTSVGQLTAGQFGLDNGLDAVQTIRADGLIEGIDEGERTADGDLTVRLKSDSDAIFDTTLAPKSLSLKFTYGTASITFAFPRVFFSGASGAVNGPGGVSVQRKWMASRPPGGHLCTVTLVNDVAAYAT